MLLVKKVKVSEVSEFLICPMPERTRKNKPLPSARA